MKYLSGWKRLVDFFKRGRKAYSNQADDIHNPALARKESRGPNHVNIMVTMAVPRTHPKIILPIWLGLNIPEREGNPAISYSFPYFMINSQK